MYSKSLWVKKKSRDGELEHSQDQDQATFDWQELQPTENK